MKEDRLLCKEDAESLAVNLLEIKLFLNSTISNVDKDAMFILADIKDYFLVTSIEIPECMQVKYYHILQDIRARYNLDQKLLVNDYIHIKIKKAC